MENIFIYIYDKVSNFVILVNFAISIFYSSGCIHTKYAIYI